MTIRYGFYLNTSGCTGCKACQIACKDKNELPVGILWRRVVEASGGEWLQSGASWIANTFTYFVSMACMHCENPICMEVCPTTAIHQRDDGIVLINDKKCVGCHYCEWACPYKALQFDDAAGVMTKCNFCYDYLDAGKAPACVSACQMRVLDFGDIDQLRAKYGAVDDIYPLPEPSITEPSIVMTPHRHAVKAESQAAKIGNLEEI
jgi:anaerobic dimethyl sulfoxide reductase subunit B